MPDDRPAPTFEQYPFGGTADPTDLADPPRQPAPVAPSPSLRTIPPAPWMGAPPNRAAPTRRVLLTGMIGVGAVLVGSSVMFAGADVDPTEMRPPWGDPYFDPHDPPTEYSGTSSEGPIDQVTLAAIGVTIPLYPGWVVADESDTRVVLTNDDQRLIVRTWPLADAGADPVALARKEANKYALGFTAGGSPETDEKSDDEHRLGSYLAQGRVNGDGAEVASLVSIHTTADKALALVSLLLDTADPVIGRQLQAMWDAALEQW